VCVCMRGKCRLSGWLAASVGEGEGGGCYGTVL